MHTRGGNDSNASIRNIPIIDDLSLLDISSEDTPKQLTLEEECPPVSKQPIEEPEVIVIDDLQQEAPVMMETDDLTCKRCGFESSSNQPLKKHADTCHENVISDNDIEKMGGKILTEFSVRYAISSQTIKVS